MKQLVLVAFLTLVLSINANAQTVISNNYEPITEDQVELQKLSDSFGALNFQYLSFDGGENYGIAACSFNPNNIGVDFGARASFKSHGNLNYDFGINYSFELVNKNDFAGYLTLAIGPSFRIQDKFKLDDDGDIDYKSGFFVDGYINPRLSIKYDRFVASIGYFYWAPKFKFSKNKGAIGGLSLAVGYCF